jgi:hypothetical protein
LVIKDKFILLKDIPNILNISATSLRVHRVEDGVETLHQIMTLLEKKINHFTKKKVYKLLKTKPEMFEVVYLPKYNLPVTYNRGTNQILINLSAFGTREISTMNPTARDLYGCLVYGVCFWELISKQSIPSNVAPHITAFLLSTFIRVFGKEYGLVGTYSTQIPKLKFIISCYIYSSFFNVSGNTMLRNSATGISYDFNKDYDKLIKYDFSDPNDFIKALDELKVFPGIGKYNFVSKILRFLSLHFIPAIEDIARFMALMTTSNVPGITDKLSPAFYYRYNETEFEILMKISKRIFK